MHTRLCQSVSHRAYSPHPHSPTVTNVAIARRRAFGRTDCNRRPGVGGLRASSLRTRSPNCARGLDSASPLPFAFTSLVPIGDKSRPTRTHGPGKDANERLVTDVMLRPCTQITLSAGCSDLRCILHHMRTGRKKPARATMDASGLHDLSVHVRSRIERFRLCQRMLCQRIPCQNC